MEHHIGSGTERDIWVMVDQDSQRRLFRLVEVEGARDVARLASDLQLPVVMIDVVMPPMSQLKATPDERPAPARTTLIVLNLRTANDGDAVGLVAYRGFVREQAAWRTSGNFSVERSGRTRHATVVRGTETPC
jgi:hypothetical protein